MNFNRQEFFIIVTVAIAFCVSTVLVIVSSWQTSIIGTAVVIFLAIAYRYPRWGLWLFLIYLPFAGTVSYAFGSIYRAVGGYVTYQSDYAIFHLAKDALYVPALIAIVISSQWLVKLRKNFLPLLIGILLLCISCLLSLFLVNLSQQLADATSGRLFLMGIVGLKIIVGYIPLLFCGYYLIRDRTDLRFLIRLQTTIIIICCSLCLIQYLLLSSGVCPGSSALPSPAATKVSLQAQCFVGGSLLYNPARQLIRLPGTFVAPWQWAWFLVSASFFSYGAFVYETKLRWRIINFSAIALVLIAAIISGQTTAMILVPIIYLILLLVTEGNKTKLGLKLGIALLLLTLIANNFGVFGSALDSVVARWNYTPPQAFIVDQFQWISRDGIQPLGYGLGRAASAARRLGKVVLIETFYPRLLYEIGWLGTVLFLAVVSLVTAYSFRAYRTLQQSSLKKLTLCLWIFILLISYNTYYYPLIVEPIAIYYWFFAGVLLKLPEIENSNQ
ncbi:MAG: hypothetical protein ACFCU5_19645 [Pleurocapsa sp.]